MEIEYLHEFAVVAELESFSRAADELCIAQSSLSKHIIALERELDLPLLDRTSRRVALTPAGARILPYAKTITEQFQTVTALARAHNDAEKMLLPIASIPVMAQYDITGALARFRAAHPGITLRVTECEQHEIAALLDSDTCELAFLRRAGAPAEDYEYADFCADRLVAALPVGHPLAGRTSIPLTALRDEPLLLLDEQTSLYALCKSLCEKAGFSPRIAYTGRRPENLLELAARGMGAALLMKRHTTYYATPSVVCAEILPPVESDVCLVRRRSHRLSSAGKAFWNEVRGFNSKQE